MSYTPLYAQQSLKKYILWRAGNYTRWFNKNKIQEWTGEYSQLTGWTYETECACRRVRQLVEAGKLKRRGAKGTGRCSHFAIYKCL